MSDNNKMREVWDAHDEARNKAWREEPGTFDTLDAFKAGAAWQAAQSVPVVGNVIGYLAGGTMMHRQIQGYECKPLVVQPTSSISTAELERLRKDAERYQAVVIISQAALRIPSARTDETNRMLSAYQKAVNASLGIEQAIDAAIAAEGTDNG